ncbi:mannosyl-glycoprotein endo-beta-N-acetylglucosamidase domain protein possible enterotoxin [Clostridium sp. CAG:793]|nr:mannosyl-glycoprotein endo-beta-N-acetylglucosamidase domain protein possible enterotoxin [Clostridium sp. CAG:793]
MKKIATTIIMIIIMTMIATVAWAATGTVNTQDLNMREGASTSKNVIKQLAKGTEVNILSEEGEWYQISVNNITGYVNKKYIDKKEETVTVDSNKGTVNTNPDMINDVSKIKETTTVYVLPLLNSTKIATIDQNTIIDIISEAGNWCYIQNDDVSGWVMASKITGKKKNTGDTSAEITNVVNNTVSNNNVENEVNVVEQVNDITTPNQTGNNIVNEVNTTVSNTVDEKTSESNTSYPVQMYVNVEAVYVRESATKDSKAVTSIGKGTPVRVTGESGDWYKVEVSDGKGYVMKQFLSK